MEDFKSIDSLCTYKNWHVQTLVQKENSHRKVLHNYEPITSYSSDLAKKR